jgi:hypothetical protein
MTDRESIPTGSERAALDRIGWQLEEAFAGDALPTIRRRHNLIVVSPPSAAYAAPALALLAARSGEARPTSLVLAHPSMLQEMAWLLARLAPTAESSFLAIPDTPRTRIPRDEPVPILLTTPARARELLAQSMLRASELETLLLAWPEAWEGDALLQDLMADVSGNCQRLIYTAAPERAAALIERHAWRALTVGMRSEDFVSTPHPVRTVSVPWHRRGEALRDTLALLDPARCAVWTASSAAREEVTLALAGMMAGVTLFHDDPPEADVAIAYDLPTPRRLREWEAVASRVLLVPPIAAHFIEALGFEDRPLRLPGALEAVRGDAAARRGAVAGVIADTPLDGAVLTLAPLFDRFDPVRVAAALYHLWSETPGKQAAASAAVAPVPVTTRMFVSVGRKDGVTVADLVAVLTKEIGVDRKAVGRIELKDTHALVELPASDAETIIVAMNGKLIRRKRVSAHLDRAQSRRR